MSFLAGIIICFSLKNLLTTRVLYNSILEDAVQQFKVFKEGDSTEFKLYVGVVKFISLVIGIIYWIFYLVSAAVLHKFIMTLIAAYLITASIKSFLDVLEFYKTMNIKNNYWILKFNSIISLIYIGYFMNYYLIISNNKVSIICGMIIGVIVYLLLMVKPKKVKNKRR